MAACSAFMAAPGGSHWLTFPGAMDRGGVRAMAQRTKSLVNIGKVIAEVPPRRREECGDAVACEAGDVGRQPRGLTRSSKCCFLFWGSLVWYAHPWRRPVINPP